MKNHVTRRALLRWLASGAGLVLAVFALPVRGIGRVVNTGPGRKLPRIPTRPFDEKELHRLHHLAG